MFNKKKFIIKFYLQGLFFLITDLIGLLYHGIEKIIEYKKYFQSMLYFDRLDYVLMIAQEYTFCLAIYFWLYDMVNKIKN